MRRSAVFFVILAFISTSFASIGPCDLNLVADAQDDFTTSEMSFDIVGTISVDSEGVDGLVAFWEVHTPDGGTYEIINDFSDIFNPAASLTVDMQGQYIFNLIAVSGSCESMDSLTVTVIPEPATVTLLVAGAFVLSRLRRKV